MNGDAFMSNMTNNITKWTLTHNVEAAGTVTNTLATSNKFVDKDIEVKVVTPAGALTGNATNLTVTDNKSIGSVSASQPASGAYITVTGSASATATTGGFIDENTTVNTTSATKYYALNNATFSVSGASVKATASGYVENNTTVGTVANGALSVTGGGLSAGSGSTAIASNGLSNGTSVDDTKSVALTETAAANYYELQASGSGSVSRAAINKQITTAGYFAKDSAAVQQIASASLSSNTATKKYYVKQSTLSSTSITPSTSQQTVTISDGYYHEDRTVTIAAMTTVTPTTSLSDVGMTTYFNTGTSSNKDVTLTPQYSNSAGYVSAHTNTNNGGVAYYKIKTTGVTQGTTSVSGTTATRGTASWGTGWITSGSIAAATFANEATNGKTYIDISATTSAPVLVSGDYLYINKGYVDDLKISLARLVPDGSDVKGHSDYILSGHSAYDDDGALVAGSISTYDGSYSVA